MELPDYNNKNELDKQSLFYASIRRIVLENFNYCNRSCSFCVNSIIDRKSKIKILEDSYFYKLIEELSNNHFSNTIALGRYSEPLAMKLTFERIRIIREQLKDANILINTNGDYLNKEIINQLDRCGLNELKIMVYLPNSVCFNMDNALKYSLAKIQKLGLDYCLANFSETMLYFKIFHNSGMLISVRCENYSNSKHGCDRGGSLKNLSKIERHIPCVSPYFEINIDYNGNVLPCCNLVSDYKPHKKYILGNILYNTLYQIYFSNKSEWFRNTLNDSHLLQKPCKYCSYNFPKQG